MPFVRRGCLFLCFPENLVVGGDDGGVGALGDSSDSDYRDGFHSDDGGGGNSDGEDGGGAGKVVMVIETVHSEYPLCFNDFSPLGSKIPPSCPLSISWVLLCCSPALSPARLLHDACWDG